MYNGDVDCVRGDQSDFGREQQPPEQGENTATSDCCRRSLGRCAEKGADPTNKATLAFDFPFKHDPQGVRFGGHPQQ